MLRHALVPNGRRQTDSVCLGVDWQGAGKTGLDSLPRPKRDERIKNVVSSRLPARYRRDQILHWPASE